MSGTSHRWEWEAQPFAGGYCRGPQQLPILWSHIPHMVILSDTSSILQNHVGNSFGLRISW